MSTTLCQTCSSQLTPPTLRTAFIPPCCQTPICAGCIRYNPRLREYIPCLRCGDLTTRDGESRVIRGRREQEWKAADRDGGDVMFDADDNEGADEIDGLEPMGDDRDRIRSKSPTGQTPQADANATPGTPNGSVDKGAEGTDAESEIVEVRHTVAKSDTVLAIARRYAADVS